jgi:hypothetical protein
MSLPPTLATFIDRAEAEDCRFQEAVDLVREVSAALASQGQQLPEQPGWAPIRAALLHFATQLDVALDTLADGTNVDVGDDEEDDDDTATIDAPQHEEVPR